MTGGNASARLGGCGGEGGDGELHEGFDSDGGGGGDGGSVQGGNGDPGLPGESEGFAVGGGGGGGGGGGADNLVGGAPGTGGAGGAGGGGGATGGGTGTNGNCGGGGGAFILAAPGGIVVTNGLFVGSGVGAIYGDLTLTGTTDVSVVHEDGDPLQTRSVNEIHVYAYAAWEGLRPEDASMVGGGGAGGGGGDGQGLGLEITLTIGTARAGSLSVVELRGEISGGAVPYGVFVAHPWGSQSLSSGRLFAISIAVPPTAAVGLYAVNVTVVDADGLEATQSAPLEVLAPAPLAISISEAGCGRPGDTVTISGTVSGGVAPEEGYLVVFEPAFPELSIPQWLRTSVSTTGPYLVRVTIPVGSGSVLIPYRHTAVSSSGERVSQATALTILDAGFQCP
jgi:hypothetical protein